MEYCAGNLSMNTFGGDKQSRSRFEDAGLFEAYLVPAIQALLLAMRSTSLSRTLVRFAGTVHVRYFAVDSQDLDNSWYSDEDYKDFKRDNMYNIKTCIGNKGQPETSPADDRHFCARGLEYMMNRIDHPDVVNTRKQYQRIILSAQTELRKQNNGRLGVGSEQALYSLSRVYTEHSTQLAIKMAEADAKESLVIQDVLCAE
jgi:hypothetical protein